MSFRPHEQRLLEIIAVPLAEAVRRAAGHLTCKAGCFGCCIGPFPITWMDADRLQRGLAQLPEVLASRIRDRARESIESLKTLNFPGDSVPGDLHPGAGDILFEERFRSLPCPVLDLETGRCQLYDHRPIACRTYGPSIRMEGRSLPHCSLNYRDLTADQIDALRVDIDPGDASHDAVTEFHQAGVKEGETVIAYALLFPGA